MKFKFFVFILTFFASSAFAASQENDVSYEETSKLSIEDRVRINVGQEISPNGKMTELSIYNKGGFSSSILIRYLYPSGGKWISVVQNKKNLSLLGNFKLLLPRDAIDLEVMVSIFTGLIWDPSKMIFSEPLCQYNNQWSDNKFNQMRIDLWGTTFNPKSALVRSAGTHHNGADTSLKCGEY